MATLHEDIQSLLNPTAAGGAWYGVNTQATLTFPYLTWLQIPTAANVTLDGATANQPARIQIDILADRVVDLPGAYDAVCAALAGASVSAVQQSTGGDAYEDALGAWRRTVDFVVWPAAA